MFHTSLETFALAETVTPPAEAELEAGPKVCESGPSTQSHAGTPTIPIEPGVSSGTIPIRIARNCIDATASCASTAGSTGAGVERAQ